MHPTSIWLSLGHAARNCPRCVTYLAAAAGRGEHPDDYRIQDINGTRHAMTRAARKHPVCK